jgi:O-acetyl-ADP-ribose deacetylase (regulator of RNase III)
MPFEIIRQDITKMETDAIVNAANSALTQGGGVCGAIFAAAGATQLQAACDRIGHCPVGGAVITDGFSLTAKHIIHAVGPIWQGGSHREEELLTSCYISALNLAHTHGLTSIAFPLISSGIYGYPKDEALRVAVSAIGVFLLHHDMTVYLVVFDKASYTLSDKLFHSIQTYIDDHYVESHGLLRRLQKAEYTEQPGEITAFTAKEPKPAPMSAVPRRLNDVVSRTGETFSQMLLRLIDESGQSDAEVYKRANIDRKLFSKIRSNPKYQPSKNTALAFAVALSLNLDRTADLLRRAGYALSPSSRFDLIVEYFIRTENYNIFEINEALFAFDESLLGA